MTEKIKYEDLAQELQNKIDSKDRLFTLFVAILASFILPLLLMALNYLLFIRPNQKVDLTYYINQSEFHPKDQYQTYIEVENIGKKPTGVNPIILEVHFQGEIIKHEWQKPIHQKDQFEEEVKGNTYRL